MDDPTPASLSPPARTISGVDHEVPAGTGPQPELGQARDRTQREPPWSLAPLGFEPDAAGFALRTALALLLAYYAAFAAQVDSASSAGVCVAIVAQPSAGMTASKAVFRVVGTLAGGVVGLLLMSVFPQDRTSALCGFALWLGVCTFVAMLLRDFRAYGAALSGYTVGIIVLGAIDAPGTALFVALDRVAAILIGIAAVLIVNLLLRAGGAYDDLVRDLRRRTAAMTAQAVDALEGRPLDADLSMVRIAAGAAALQTQASYAAVEMPGGQVRANGARHVIAALLAMVSASRAIAATAGPDTPPEVRAYLRRAAAALAGRGAAPGLAPWPGTPADALLLERTDELLACRRDALRGLLTLTEGAPALPPVRLRASHDLPAALAAAVRVLVAVGFCASFCVLAGWSGATLLLIQQSAFVALFATLPNPARASLMFGVSMIPAVPAVLACKFLLLPSASGFVPFSLAVGGMVFVAALAVQHRAAGPYISSLLLMLTLLLAPANPQTFNLADFWDTALQIAASAVFTTATFSTVLRTAPGHRLAHVALQIAQDLRRTLRDGGRRLDRVPAQSLLYDRMAQAIGWMGAPTPGRTRLLGHVFGMGEVDLAVRRAHSGLAAAATAVPEVQAAVAEAGRSLSRGDLPAMLRAAQVLLEQPAPAGARHSLRQAASGLAGAAFLLRPERGTVRLHRRMLA